MIHLFISLFALYIIYYIYNYIFKVNRLYIDKVNIGYENILSNIKKENIKKSLKIKKGTFFNFFKTFKK